MNTEPPPPPPVLPNRKHPAHHPPVRHHNAPVVLFVTIAIRPRGNALANDAFHRVFQSALMAAGVWRVFLHVIMPDHIHLFAVPQTIPPYPVVKWAEYLKRQTTLSLGKHPEWDWQPGCWDTQIRDRDHYVEKSSYVRMNPVRAGLCATPEEWKWRGEGEWVPW